MQTSVLFKYVFFSPHSLKHLYWSSGLQYTAGAERTGSYHGFIRQIGPNSYVCVHVCATEHHPHFRFCRTQSLFILKVETGALKAGSFAHLQLKRMEMEDYNSTEMSFWLPAFSSESAFSLPWAFGLAVANAR